MAKRQQQVNKNLVAGLTFFAMFATVAVVAVLTVSATYKDPKAIAEKASIQEENGNFRDAANLYMRAFNVNREVQYLIDAHRCAYKMGELSQAIQALVRAHAQAPEDVQVLNALLERYWELRRYGGNWQQIKEYADKALAIQGDNLLALVSRAGALEAMQASDPSYAEQAEAALQQALEIDADDPRVVEVRVRKMVGDAVRKARRLREDGATAGAEEALEQMRAEAEAIFRRAIAKHPKSNILYLNLAQVLMDAGRFAEIEPLFAQGLVELPDDERMHYGLAAFHHQRAAALQEQDPAEARRHVEAGLAAAGKAIELEPALYEAYTLRAAFEEQAARLSGAWDEDRVGQQTAILERLEQALVDTVGLRTVTAVLGRENRARMLASAFDRAFAYYQEQSDAAARERLLPFVESLRERARSEYTESVLVPLIDGQYALLMNDTRGAIQAFTSAEDKAGAFSSRYELMAKEQLARLYTMEGENGVALKYTEDALAWYAREGAQAPQGLRINQATLLTTLGRAQEALDLVEAMLREDPGNPRLAQTRAAALYKLERADEARAALEEAQDDTGSLGLMQARIAAASDDLVEAERIVREVLAAQPQNLAAITLAVQVLVKQDRRAEAAGLLDELKEQVSDPRIQRVIEAQRIMVQVSDPEERQRQLFAMIEQIPDEVQRNGEYFNYYFGRGEYEKAAPYADRLEQLRPDDVQVLSLQFQVTLQLKQFQRTEQYVTKLAERNADRAGGSTYRGQLLLAQEDLLGALTELRVAERALPTNSALKLQIAQVLWYAGRYDQAVEAIKQAIELDPTRFEANKLAYQLLERLGRDEEAFEYLRAAAELNPKDPFILEREQELTDAYRPREAIAQREARRAESPDDLENLVKLGRLYLRLRQYPLAEERLKAAAALDAGDRRMALLGADLYGKLQQREAGEALLEAYIEDNEGMAKLDAVIHLAGFYEMLGDAESVQRAYERALATAEGFAGDEARSGRVRGLRAMARYYARRNDAKRMVARLREVLPLLGDTEEERYEAKEVRLSIVRGYLAQSQLDEAQRELEEFKLAFTEDNGWLVPAAELAVRRGQLKEARELLTQVLEIDPNHTWSLWTRGRVLIELGRFDDARQDLLKAKELAPRGFGLQHRVRLAQLYRVLDRHELAESEWRELVALAPENRAYAAALIGLLRETHQLQRALEFVGQMVTRFPEDAYWPAQVGQLLMERNEYSAAIAPLKEAVEKSQRQNPAYIAQWLEAMILARRIDEALAAVEQLDPQVMAPPVLMCVAQANLERGNRTAALAALRDAVRKASQASLGAVGYVGTRMVELLGRDGAHELLGAEIARPETSAAAGAQLRWFLARDQILADEITDKGEALRAIDELVSNSEAGSALAIEALLTKAYACERAGEREQAVQCYEQVLGWSPNDVRALNNAAYVLSELGRTEQAIGYAEKARDARPGDANILDTLGWAYFKAERLSSAETTLLQALSYDAQSLPVMCHLGALYQKLNRTAEARRYYERAIKAAADQQQTDSNYYREAQEALRSLE